MRGWWDERDGRERVLIGIMGALMLAFGAWLLLTREGAAVSPDLALAEAQTDRELWLRAKPKLTPGASIDAKQDFSRGVLIDRARAKGVELSRVQPQGDGALGVWTDGTTTQAIYGLLVDVTTNYAVEITDVFFATSADGSLNAQFTLSPI
jgi:type II secretory pathway component PulM